MLVFLLPLFFLPFSFEKFELNKQYLLFFLVSLAFLTWLAKMILFDKEIKFKKSPLNIFVLAFFFIAVFSAIFSVDKLSSLFGFYGRFSDSLIGLFSFCLFYFLITNNVGIEKETKEGAVHSLLTVQSLLKTFFWSAFFVVLFSYFSIFGVFEKINSLFVGKFSLPAIMLQSGFNPVTASMDGLAVFLSIISVFLIGRILISDKKKKPNGQIFNYLLLVAISILLLIIDSKVAWLIIFLSLILFLPFVLWKRMFKEDVNKLLLPIFFAILAFTLVFINTSGLQGLILKNNLLQEQFLGQGDSWIIGLKSATENVKSGFLGSGIGTFHYDFSKFKPLSFNQSAFWQIRIDRPGNYFAEVLGTMGFLGIISYIILISLFLLISYVFLQKNKNSIPLLVFFLALFFGQFFYYQNTILAFAFWLVLGLSAASWHSSKSESEEEKTISFKKFPEMSLIFSILLIIIILLFLGVYFFAAQFYLADVNYRKGLEENNVESLEQAAKLNPYQPQYKIFLARYYLGKANSLIEEGVLDQNQLICNASLALAHAKGGEVFEVCLNPNANPSSTITIKGVDKISPNRVAVQETLGIIYRDFRVMMGGQEVLKWGIQYFEKAISLEPINPVLRTEVGKLYLFSNDIEKAKENFSKAKELKPDYIDASIQLALVYEQENNAEEAIKQMEVLVTSFPLNVEAIFQLGRLYLNNNQVDKAIAQFEKSVQLFPSHSNSLYSLGLAYQKKGQTDKALAYFERVLELNPGNADVISKINNLTQTEE